MPSNILNFSSNRLITGINVIDGMLFFTDNENEPKKINIEKFKGNFEGVEVDHSSGTTHIYGRQIREGDITVVKDHPITSMTTQKFDEAFGTGANDLTTDSVSKSKTDGIDKNGNKITNPSEGHADISIDAHSTSNTSFTGRLLLNEGQLVEGGFIWSATEDTIEGLINGIGSSSVEITSKNIELGGGIAIIQESIQSTNSSGGNYNATLSTGEIFVVSFGKKKGNSKRFYSNIAKSKILNNAVAGTAPSDLTSSDPIIVDNKIKIDSILNNDGDSKIVNSGLYISEGRINDNEAAPTVQDLLDEGNFISSTFDQGTGKLISSFEAVPNLIYYYVPFATNKNGTVYGNNLSLSDTVTSKVQNRTKPTAPVNTLNVTEHTNTSAILRGYSNGNNYLNPLGYAEITELGFYFSSNESIKEDIITKSFTNGVSTDGKTFKVSVTDDYDKGGIFSLNTASYLTIKEGEELNFIAYNISGGTESCGNLEKFKKPEYTEEPLFNVFKAEWNFPSTYNLSTSGTENIEVTAEFDIIGKPNKNNTNIVDAGIIISKPITKAEIEKSENGVWVDIPSIVNPNNSFTLTIPKSDFTFTANVGDPDIGRYTTTNPIIVPAITTEEYYNLIEEGIKISSSNFRMVAYIIGENEVTYYSQPFGDLRNDNVNPDTKPKLIKPLVGGPKIVNSNSNNEFITVKEDDNFTIVCEISNTGKRIVEVGAYVSTTPPPSINILPDGRSTDLDAWAAGATKHLATESVSTINAHIDQNTNDFLDITIPCTGKTAETTYYVAVFAKPEQTLSTTANSKVVDGGEPFINLLNGTKWATPKRVDTPANLSAVDVDPILTIIDDNIESTLTKTSVSVKCKAEKPSLNYSITEIGVYLKPASEFPNPFSDQSGNAATMASATNRIEKKLDLTNTKENGKNEEINFTANVTGITTVEYYASTFVKTNTNGNIQTFISPYISIDNTPNTLLLPTNYTKRFTLAIGDAVYSGPISLTVSGGAAWSGGTKPEIINHGFYFLENQSLQEPSSAAEFMEEYDSPSVGTTKYNVTISGEPYMRSSGREVFTLWNANLPFNIDFPTDNANKKYYVVAFYETVDNFFGISFAGALRTVNPTEYSSSGRIALDLVNIKQIEYRNNNVYSFRETGLGYDLITNSSNPEAGKWYEYVDIDVKTSIGKEWEFVGTFSLHDNRIAGSIPASDTWPAPIIRNGNTLRVYTPKNNPPSQKTYLIISVVTPEGEPLEVGDAIYTDAIRGHTTRVNLIWRQA
jgi:hypothetical protein